MNYEKLSKNALKTMYCATVINTLIGLAILALANYWIPPNPFTEFLTIGSLILALILILNMLISPYFRFHRYRYGINDEYIDISEGYLFVERNIVPIERLHKVKTERGPIDQLFQVEKVIISTAGGDVTLRFLDVQKADWIADTLKQKINQIAVKERNGDTEG